MKSQLSSALRLLALMTLFLGLAYPLAVTGIAQLFFPEEANGSLLVANGQAVGSELIGQYFSAPTYFWSRPSATDPPYNAASSAGLNLAPTNSELLAAVDEHAAALRLADPTGSEQIPVDLVTASGSGLDPHISIAAALYQVPRVAAARGLSEADLAALIEELVEPRQLGVLGEPRVNVLHLNLVLDQLTSQE